MDDSSLFYNENYWIALAIVIVLVFLIYLIRRLKRTSSSTKLERFPENPILTPIKEHWWESEAVFNPAAFVDEGRVHLFYRALGRDGISRIGYASSADGIHFERLPYPVFAAENVNEARSHHSYTSPLRLTYDTLNNPSGGGWGGCEDPRAVKMDGVVYMTFNMFNGWGTMRTAMTSIGMNYVNSNQWNWKKFVYLSGADDRQKNWMLFPEKIRGKFALLHDLYSKDGSTVMIEYFKEIDGPLPKFKTYDHHKLPSQDLAWHVRIRSAGAPPIKTKYGWLVLYHAHSKGELDRYKVGALLLDLKNPKKVLYRGNTPMLEPDMWYENDWKPGIVYASGAVVFNDDLIVYYGGGDKYVAAAKVNLESFLKKLMSKENKQS